MDVDRMLAELVNEGLVEIDGNEIHLTEKGHAAARVVGHDIGIPDVVERVLACRYDLNRVHNALARRVNAQWN